MIGILTSCDVPVESDLSARTLEVSQADDALSAIRIALPEQYRFIAGYFVPPPFSGKSAYFLRYDDAEKVDLRALAEMNSSAEFGPVLQAKCASELSRYSLVSDMGLHCEESMPLTVIRNDGLGAGDLLAAGSQAIVVPEGDDPHQIYVYSEGT
ncbi:hypothetical protein [Gordonia insulae]|uniref:Uncharacterized protein n=1 Tax=Gordonia insulae TaxID=2420509 RepID=A0A3G8JMQ8_9ACTN|nr:hypothetical protein [Gordonia insulae]AZG46273.1 hypothetical protein D7316_02874 [Gordonia insulae]